MANGLQEFPAGYRFCPTDEELVDEYLRKKVNNVPFGPRHKPITEVDIAAYSPAVLAEKYKQEKDAERYFFTPRYKKYANGSRPDRNVRGGNWRPTAANEPILDEHGNTVGYKQPLAFYAKTGRNKKMKKTDWLMHEYKLNRNSTPRPIGKKLDEWVLVKIYKKRGNANKEKKNQSSVDECGPSMSPCDPIPYNNQAHFPPPPPPVPAPAGPVGVKEMQNQASHPLSPSPILTIPPLAELPPLPENHFFNEIGQVPPSTQNHYFTDMGLYCNPNHAMDYPFDSQCNQAYQPSGPPSQMEFGQNEAAKLEWPNVKQFNFNPAVENGMQSAKLEWPNVEQFNVNPAVVNGMQSAKLQCPNAEQFNFSLAVENGMQSATLEWPNVEQFNFSPAVVNGMQSAKLEWPNVRQFNFSPAVENGMQSAKRECPNVEQLNFNPAVENGMQSGKPEWPNVEQLNCNPAVENGMQSGKPEWPNVEQLNCNPAVKNGMQSQQIGGYNSQPGQCSSSQTVLGGWQADYMGLEIDYPSKPIQQHFFLR